MAAKHPPTLSRRQMLAAGAVMAAAPRLAAAAAAPQDEPPFLPYGHPAKAEADTVRIVAQPFGDTAPGIGVATTPLERLEGSITPNGLHFTRNHAGVPAIDPNSHRLLIHGLTRRPLEFTLEALARYPLVSRTCFIECAGNSFYHALSQPKQIEAGVIHGMLSAAEWTGVPLSALLDEAGVRPEADWLLVEGDDAVKMSRSLPLSKAMDDCLLALYQNGERLRPEQGYPLRLIVPGWQGALHIKWLRRIKLTQGPTHTRDETSRYSLLMPDGTAEEFPLAMPVKSLITNPSFGRDVAGPGLVQISGLAWSGKAPVATVEISADGGKTWTEAVLDGQTDPCALRRFRLGWTWDGKPAVLQSRARDASGAVQPTHAQWKATYNATQRFTCNAIQSWSVDRDGSVENILI